jgi:hypothetical protein
MKIENVYGRKRRNSRNSLLYLGVPIYLLRGGLCRIHHEYGAEMISRLKGIDGDIGKEIKSERNHYVHFLPCRNIFIFPVGIVARVTEHIDDFSAI